MIYCHKCGAEQVEEAEFCPECGAKLVAKNNNSTTEKPKPTTANKSVQNNESTQSTATPKNDAVYAGNNVQSASVPVKKKSHAKTVILIVIAIIIIIGIISVATEEEGTQSNTNTTQSNQQSQQNNGNYNSDTNVGDECFQWVNEPTTVNEEYGKYIKGSIKNISGKDLFNIWIQYKGYDKDGNELGDFYDYTLNLKPGNTWEFDVSLSNDVVRYELIDVEYHEEE